MITLFLISAFLSPGFSFAQSQDTITDKAAYLTFCPKGAMDCGGATIHVKGKSYRALGNTPAIQEQLSNVIDTYRFHNLAKSAPFEVTGYEYVHVSTGGGWGPPAGTKTTMFKITAGLNTLNLPK